jgi:NADH-quinone oxidoreductase subunit L
MAIPLLILVVPSVVSGFCGAPFLGNQFAAFVDSDLHHAVHEVTFNPLVASISVIVALIGIGLAWAMYGGGKLAPAARLTAQFRPIYELLMRRYYIDDLYNAFVQRVVLGLGHVATWFDGNVIDATVNGTGALALVVGSSLRRIQTGQVQAYAWVLFAGFLTVAALIAALRLGQ